MTDSERTERLEAAIQAAREVREIKFGMSALAIGIGNALRHAMGAGVPLDQCSMSYVAVVERQGR